MTMFLAVFFAIAANAVFALDQQEKISPNVDDSQKPPFIGKILSDNVNVDICTVQESVSTEAVTPDCLGGNGLKPIVYVPPLIIGVDTYIQVLVPVNNGLVEIYTLKWSVSLSTSTGKYQLNVGAIIFTVPGSAGKYNVADLVNIFIVGTNPGFIIVFMPEIIL